MIIPVTEEWLIASDPHQWIIQRYKGTYPKKKGGEPVEEWANEAYYPTYKMAAERLGELMVRRLPSNGIEEAIADIEEIGKLLGAALPRLTVEVAK